MNNFTFAGFTFPRMLATMPRGTISARLKKFKKRERKLCGPYYHAPRPIDGETETRGFYDSETDNGGRPFTLRMRYADDVDDAGIRHNGWFTDDDGDGETIRGVAFLLNHARGFLAGWTMGAEMCASVDTSHLYEDLADAAMAADAMAERVAEQERDANRESRAIEDARAHVEQVESELATIRAQSRVALVAYLDALAKGASLAAELAKLERKNKRATFVELHTRLRTARETLAELEN